MGVSPMYSGSRARCPCYGGDQQVVVIAHQDVSVHGQREPLRAAPEPRQEAFVVPHVAEDRPPLVAPVQYVIERVFPIDPQRSRHADTLTS